MTIAEPELPDVNQQAGWWSRRKRSTMGNGGDKFAISDHSWFRCDALSVNMSDAPSVRNLPVPRFSLSL